LSELNARKILQNQKLMGPGMPKELGTTDEEEACFFLVQDGYQKPNANSLDKFREVLAVKAVVLLHADCGHSGL
jgi:hypothetical protein